MAAKVSPHAVTLFWPQMNTDKHGWKAAASIAALMLFISGAAAERTFRDTQLKFPRVRAARDKVDAPLRAAFAQKKLAYPPQRVFLRVFKQERVLEVWVAESDAAQFQLFKEYKMCASSGELGPKRRVGDRQIPEGFYFISDFNPTSAYHLSLRVSYPNESDRKLGAADPGGDIFIHGDCLTIGCAPITDDGIREVYWLAVEARSAGQARIPAHIFPARLSESGLRALESANAHRTSLLSFWRTLKQGYDAFERNHIPPRVTVNRDGSYNLKE